MPKPTKNKIVKKLRNEAAYHSARFGMFLFNAVPRKVAVKTGELIGRLTWYIARHERELARKHLRYAWGDELTEEEITRIIREMFKYLGMNLADTMRLARMSDEEFEGMITVHNEEVIESHVADEKQVVIVTGHLGCWEILRAWLPFKGLKLASIAKRLYDVRLEKLLLRSRQSTGTQVITVGRNTRDLFRLIRDGYSPGFLIDVDTNVKGVFVHFFGHLSFTPAAAAEIALKYDMPVILPLPYRDRDGQHHIEIHGPLKVTKTGDTQVDTVSLTAAATKVIEDFIRRHPEQWPWFHKRWKRKPPEETQ